MAIFFPHGVLKQMFSTWNLLRAGKDNVNIGTNTIHTDDRGDLPTGSRRLMTTRTGRGLSPEEGGR